MSRTLISWFPHTPRNRSTVRAPLEAKSSRTSYETTRPHGGPAPAAVRFADDVVVKQVPLMGSEGLPRREGDHALLPLRVDEYHLFPRAQRPRWFPSLHQRFPPLPTFSFSRQNAHVSAYDGAPQRVHFARGSSAPSCRPTARPSSEEDSNVPLLCVPLLWVPF